MRTLLASYPEGPARTAVAEAGMEFYDKMETRGKLLRQLAKHGQWYYDESGRLSSWVEEPEPFERIKLPLKEALEGKLRPSESVVEVLRRRLGV